MIRVLKTSVLTLLGASTLGACGASRSPVPLVGSSNDVSALAGEWSGDYSSAQSGRSGSISFTLRAAADSAFGDVVMIPAGWGRALAPWRGEAAPMAPPRPPSQGPTINLLRVEQGHLNRTLPP